MRFLAITFLGVFAHLAASAAVSPIEKRQGECIFTKCCDVNGHSTTFCFNWGERCPRCSCNCTIQKLCQINPPC
ncbi:unnamed protein product [Zymoseptoria tritici ST99CH_1A5]|uniref:Uncharacterized protein n=3 Tax=Zymoseptoria tritici TaxID=1047171 RepID=A0A1X7S153_ZYMT9|nr:unnamed protein product [Zymoseptoria tritici ST99CH_3D7]SMR56850.1 unnamed protein product [Zymoseptoria tritici ST99CH_1E4]SMR59710.1 unnamed protein product [Zymoseptoria tritici ST99CH_3D1]SMY26898.1 unnamed protein product [Zymoseptoria tritici ST99CH_1A5]